MMNRQNNFFQPNEYYDRSFQQGSNKRINKSLSCTPKSCESTCFCCCKNPTDAVIVKCIAREVTCRKCHCDVDGGTF